MSSKKDLVEAHSFNRRRLVTAFVSGAPGGREVEPVRYGRTLVGGTVLAALLVAGGALTGLLKPTVPKDWLDQKAVIGKDSGSRFVAFGGTLYPVINTASARLLVSTDGSFQVITAPEDLIAEQPQGTTVGIPGAPDVLPAPDHLLQTGWTACTDPGQATKVSVAEKPGAVVDRGGALVARSPGSPTVYVVTGQHRYPVPSRAATTSLRALGLDAETIQSVPGRWLDLFSDGSPLQPFDVRGSGTGSGKAGSLGPVGTPLRVGERRYVVTSDGVVELSPFAYTMYRSTGPGAQLAERSVDVADLGDVHTVDLPGLPDDWPRGLVHGVADTTVFCALLDTRQDGAATTSLARVVGEDAAPDPERETAAAVQSGHGALVFATSAGVLASNGNAVGTTLSLVDATGTRYTVGAKNSSFDAQTRLGYRNVSPVGVPATWLALFPEGPTLDRTAAAQPVTAQ